MRDCPTLRNDQITLRAHIMADFPALCDAYGDDHLQFMGGPLDQKQTWMVFCKDVAQWALLGHGAWAIDMNDTGTFVGQIYLSKHPYFAELELGWMVLPTGQGKSIAHGAAKLAQDWIYQVLKPNSLVSYIHQDNLRSIVLAERLCARLDPDAPPCPYEDHVVYRHTVPEALL